MSEVKRWEPRNTIVGYDMQPLPDGSFVLFEDFNRVTAERDALQERLSEANDLVATQCCVFCNDTGNLRAVSAELQQRLTAADEALDKAADEFALMSLEAGQRMDVLEGLLQDLKGVVAEFAGSSSIARKAYRDIEAALKPAEIEPYQGIPGTSFQCLNALANQGE